MESTQLITLKVPRTETENLFLQRVVQAAIQAYRNDQHANDTYKQGAAANRQRTITRCLTSPSLRK